MVAKHAAAFHNTSFQFYITGACIKKNITWEETLERECVIIHECRQNGKSVSAY